MADDPQDPSNPGFVERRRRPRNPDDAASWEQVAIRRVARRVKTLPDTADPVAGEDADFGWERAVLERLRRRLDEG